MGKLSIDNSPVYYSVTGSIITDGISISEFNNADKTKRVVYSVGMQLDEKNTAFINALAACVEDSCQDESFTCINPIKDGDKIYFKLATDAQNKNFKATISPAITPKKCAEIAEYQSVTFSGWVEPWYNIQDKTCGLSFNAREFDFTQDDTPRTPTKVFSF